MSSPVGEMLDLLDSHKGEIRDQTYIELMKALQKIHLRMSEMSKENDEKTNIISVCAKNISAGDHVIYRLTDKVTSLEENVADLKGYNKSLENKVAGLNAYNNELKDRIKGLRAELKGDDQSKDEKQKQKQHVFPLDQSKNDKEQDLRAYDDVYHAHFCKGRTSCDCKLSTK